MAIIIRVEEIKSQDLKPGDLFSSSAMEHWGSVNQRTGDILPIGEKVYIRTNAPTPEDQIGIDMVRLTMEIVSDHASYHPTASAAEDSPNPNCPYCKGELVEDTEAPMGSALAVEDIADVLDLPALREDPNPQEEVQCPNCEGQAEVDGETCTGCDGTGTLAKEDFDANGH